jgi:hypothetical protein
MSYQVEGEYLEACSCSVSCPCIFLLAAAPFASHLTMTGGQARTSGLVALALVALTALALIAQGRKFRVAGPAHQEGK